MIADMIWVPVGLILLAVAAIALVFAKAIRTVVAEIQTWRDRLGS